MNLKKLLLAMICLSSMFLSASCANKVILHPLKDTDIYTGKNAGDVCFSAYYLETVLKAKIDK